MRSKNKSGFRGVTLNNYGGWQARAYVNGHSVALGTFPTPELASDAYESFIARNKSTNQPKQNESASPEVAPVPPLFSGGDAESPQPSLAAIPEPTEQPMAWPWTRIPGHCPRCGSELWGPCSGDGMICKQCGLQTRVYNPPGPSRKEYESEEWQEMNRHRGTVTR
jgi:hypothetical protein